MSDGDSRALLALALQSQGHPVALAGTRAVIRRFNRDTMLLATGLLGALIFAALVLAVQELHPKAAVVKDEATRTGGDLSLNANPAALSKIVGLDAGNTDEMSSGPVTNADDGGTPQISHPNTRSGSPAHRQDSGRVIRPKNPRVRAHPSLWAKIADVFIFWYRKPEATERSRGWAQVSNRGSTRRGDQVR